MEFSISGMLAALLFGTIGLWLLREAKRQAKFSLLGIALGLMAYPYFTSGPVADWGIGIALCALAYKFWREG